MMEKKFILFLSIVFLISCSKSSLREENLKSGKPQGSVTSSSGSVSLQGDPTSPRRPITPYLENTQEVINSLVSHIHSNLPEKESSAIGFVVSVRDQDIYVDLTAKDGVQIGSELRAYREEEVLKHPVTGEILGTPTRSIGILRVTQVEQNYSVAMALSMETGETISPKDRVELLASKNTLALLPFFSNSMALSSVDFTPLQTEIATRFQATGAFEIIQGGEVEKVIKEKRIHSDQILDQSVVRELARELKSNYLLDGLVHQEGDTWVLTSRLLASADGTTLLETSVPLVLNEQVATASTQPLLEKPEDPGTQKQEEKEVVAPLSSPISSQTQETPESKPDVSPQQGARRGGEIVEVARSQVFPFAIHGLDVGDLYGDGRRQLVLIGPTSVQIYALPQVFKENQVDLEELSIHRGSGNVLHLSIGVGDINKNGRDEVFVTSLQRGRLSSFVLEYNGGEFETIAQDQNLFFRVLKDQGRSPQLLVQRFGGTAITAKPFFGDLMIYEWRDNRYQASRDQSFPGKTDIYGFTLFSLGNGKEPGILFLDEDDRLKLSRGGRITWRSGGYYGGSRLTFTKIYDQETVDVVLQASPTRDEFRGAWRVPIKEKILTEDLDRDGIPEVILRKNTAPVRIVKDLFSYQKGQMVILRWNGISFQEAYTTSVLDSYISDYQLVPEESAKSNLLIVGLSQDEGFFLPTQQSLLMFYKLLVY